jgi:uncharacterized protein (DUF1330 family)
MSVFAIALVTITDRAMYQNYAERFLATLAPFRGRLLAADEQPKMIEGEAPGRKVVLLQFEDEDGFREWFSSPGYQAIVGDRHRAAESAILLVRGFES